MFPNRSLGPDSRSGAGSCSRFAEYTSGNPDIHISAGMAFIDGKYPVYQAAEDAKDAIDEARDGWKKCLYLPK